MTGRVIIVTGASSGLGYEVARYLCEGGNDVILACRNEEKANRAIEKIKRTNPNALATFMNLDLADMASIKKFVDDFHETGKKLHILINNAGIACSFKDPKRQYTKDNFEATMGTNHLGHFLLTNLLLEDLKKVGTDGEDARIITVSSSMHDPESMKRRNRAVRDLVAMDMENVLLLNEGTYNGLQAYKNSKAANLMFTYELARRLEGSGVTANAVDPGFVPSTDLMRSASGAQKFFCRYILHGMLRFAKITRTVNQGAMAICNLATDEKLKGVSGKYYKDGAEAKSSEETLDEEKQKKFWEMSGGYTKMEGYEPIDVPEPPPPEEEKKEEKKEEEKKEGEGEAEEKKEDAAEEKKEGEEEEKKEEEAKEETKEEEKKEEETKEEEKKEEIKEEEKKEEEQKTESEEKKE